MDMKKSSFGSKLEKVKVGKEINESTNASDSDKGEGKEGKEETEDENEKEETSYTKIIDEIEEDVDVNKVLRNNDLLDTEDFASNEENKTKSKKTSINSDNDEDMNNEDESEDELLLRKKKKGAKGGKHKVLKNNDLLDTEDSASDEENKTKNKKTSINSDNDKDMNNEDESEDELLLSKKKKGAKGGKHKVRRNNDLLDTEDSASDEENKTKSKKTSINSDNDEDRNNEDENEDELLLSKKKIGAKRGKRTNIVDETDGDVDVNKVLRNNDLFDMEDSASDEENKTKSKKTSINSDNDEDMNNEDENEDEVLLSKKKKGAKGGKCTSKDAMKESKSEQQRLLRQQTFKLPYHIAEARPLKDFLQRVPVLKTSKEKKKERADKEETVTIVEDDVVVEKGDGKLKQGIDSLFKQKPKLSFGNEETIEFEESIEFGDVKTIETNTKKKGVLDSFMARFEKHTKNRRKELQNKDGSSPNQIIVNDVANTKKDDKLPGGRRVAFKEHMRQKIKKERCEILKEVEKEMKLYNEESESEEDNESDDSDDDDDDDEDDNKEKNDQEDDDVGAGDDGGESSNDEELAKWNLDDERKALEVEMNEEEEDKSKQMGEGSTNSVDFSIEAVKTTHPERQEKDDLMQWDDTSSTVSSVLPAGQGDPTSTRKNSDGGRMTPFSKLLKSGLLDSASKQNDNSCSNHGPPPALSLPCEDTQDLYKDISVSAGQLDEDESESVFDNFRIFMNEESQYTQALDSQGFLNDSKKSKRQPAAKRLFDEDEDEKGVNDFSQVIGLCSGKFDDDNCTSSVGAGSTSNKNEVNRVCSSNNNELSMSQVIGLCSGKFSDDDTMASTKIDSTSKSNVVCNENETSLSNPPMEHPFSSRIHKDGKPDKQSGGSQIFRNESQFADTSENIFASDVVHPNLSKPSCISDIIDDNFDDNAIDYCTAPFSTQSTNVCDVEGGTQKIDDRLLPETKFDVGNWLKSDKEIDDKESESRSSDSSNDIGGVGKTTRKQRIVESDEDDNEDNDFDDEDNKDNEEEEGERDGDDEEEEDEIDNKGDVDDVSGSENEDGEDYEDEDEVNHELLEYQDAIADKKKKWSKNAFTEKEAELSGSDVNSDDEELGSEYDEYEVDSDIENLPDAEKLKRQVHKIHQRRLIDEDQKQIKELQERFLEDGDIGDDGKKRQRNFKWRNIDDDVNFNATAHSGDEEDELNLDGNISQKLERAEREKYIYELQESQKALMDENSQSMLEMIKDQMSVFTEQSTQKLKTKLVSKVEGRVLSQKQLGSFLSQKKSSLSHLSSAAKAGGGQGSKAFVFQATEEEKKVSADKENKGVARKASFTGPARKRLKVSSEVETSESQSIFDLL